MLTFMSDYGHEGEVLAQAEAHPELYTFMGPTRTTSILACIPAYTSASGGAITVPSSASRAAASMGAAGHIDVDQVRSAAPVVVGRATTARRGRSGRKGVAWGLVTRLL